MEQTPKIHRRWFRFSLQDMLWSVSLACGGIGLFLASYRSGNILAVIPLVLLPGMLWGAAIGKLFQRGMVGAMLGLIAWVAVIIYRSFPAIG